MQTYEELGEITKQAVIQTMMEGEATHPDNKWREVDIREHVEHLISHCAMTECEIKIKKKYGDEDHITHALTRLAMIKYLEGLKCEK
jgi:hypothetical protein